MPVKERVEMTKKEWFAKGTALFGPDVLKWKFVCPACGNVQTPEEFRQYADEGAKPDDARFNCIGRYDGHMHVDMGAGKPCNYTGGGLFGLNPVMVDGRYQCFSFYEDDTA